MMKYTSLLIALISLAGCSSMILTANCIDAQFERDPVEKNYLFSITNIQTGETETRKIICRGAYSAQCSARGNGWHWAQNEVEPYKVTLSPNEDAYLLFPACYSFERGNIDKKSHAIHLSDGRYLSLKSVWGKTESINWPQGYKPYRDPDNQYIYYMNDPKIKKSRKRKAWPATEEGKQRHYMELNEEESKRTPYIIPLNFSYKAL